MSRGRLSSAAVEKLYGQRLRLSASRIDKFASCRFAYFCQYGLRAKPYEPAAFRPPEIGTFMHYVLEKTAREVKRRGGFAAVDDKTLRELCERFTAQYVSEELNDFNEKRRRFVYLFNRLCGDVWRVVEDMAAEPRRSDFEPLDFELDFSDAREMPPVELGGGEDSLVLSGIADRVDGWYHDGKLYLRVVDYKTGRKEFSMSDVWYGMGFRCCCISSRSKQTAAGAMTVKSSPRASCTSPRAAASSPCRATRTRSPFQPSAQRSSGAAALCARTQRSLRHGSAATISAISP